MDTDQTTINPFYKNNKAGVLSFGELLLRICPDTDGDWLRENSLPFYVGGAEANVATALALWNVPSFYFTALPDNPLSEQVLEYLQKQGINTSPVLLQGDRMGLYYLTKGKDLKNAGVIYDRANTSFSQLRPQKIDWKKVFEGISWFHFSAICPAINEHIVAICDEALQYASENKITISLDLNYRAKLWKYGKQPDEVMPQLAKYCDLIMGNIWAAERMLNIPFKDKIEESDDKEIYVDQAKKTSELLIERYPNCKAVANTFRFDAGKQGIKYYTTLYTNTEFYTSTEYNSETIVDKVGSGDCFMAGLIYGFYNDLAPQQILEFATAAAFKKLFIESDATNLSAEEIQKYIA